MLARVVLVLLISLFSAEALAAVIFSSCPVPQTQTGTRPNAQAPLVDRFRADGWRDQVQVYSEKFPKALRYTRWLFSNEPDTRKFHDSDPAAREAGLWIEDAELLRALSEDEPECYDEGKPVATEPIAIFPFALRADTGRDSQSYRLRYKLCRYYVDSERQLPIEEGCTVIGRSEGYTFEELTARFNQLNENVENSRELLEGGVVGVALIASIPIFRSLRIIKASTLTSLAAAIAPPGLAYLAVRENLTDDLIRDAVDFRNANEVALTGDLSTNIKVNMPMQRFVPYFIRYLESLK